VNLYELLPTIYRRRDAELYEVELRALEAHDREFNDDAVAQTDIMPLKALFAVLQSQYDLLEREIGELYDDWFVETADAGVLGQLAEPFAIADLDALARGGADTRAIVANILQYRRKKGSAEAFELLARDATRWTVRVTDRLATMTGTSRVNGASTLRSGYANLRRGPDTAASPARITSAGVQLGRGPSSVDVEVFRVRAMHVIDATPGFPDEPGTPDPRRRTFSPVGDPKRLMRPTDDSGTTAVPYTRADARSLAVSGKVPGIVVKCAGAKAPLRSADLSLWQRPPGAADSDTVFVDPELGRLLTPRPNTVYTAEYWQADNDGIGAAPPSLPWSGTYDRTLLVAFAQPDDAGAYRLVEARLISRLLDEPCVVRADGEPTDNLTVYADLLRKVYFDDFAAEWAYITTFADRRGKQPTPAQFNVKWPSFEHVPSPATTTIEDLIEALSIAQKSPRTEDSFERFRSLGAALRAAESASGSVRIVLPGSRTHGTRNGGWTFEPKRWLDRLYIESAPGGRPTIAGSLRIVPLPRPRMLPLAVELRGLNVGSRIACSPDAVLTIVSSTLRPPPPDERGAWSIEEALENEKTTRPGTIHIVGSIVGGARLGQQTALTIEDSIVSDPVAAAQPGAPGPKLDAHRSTFLGTVDVAELTASDVLFDKAVTVAMRHRGFARYCAVRPESELPRTYACAPRTNRQLLESTSYGHLRFARLRADAPLEVREGGSNGAEIGAYGPYGEARRMANLRSVMAEYLPEGVSPRVIYRS